jgi:RNA polymerase sigma-70 factor (ECF subfamily)
MAESWPAPAELRGKPSFAAVAEQHLDDVYGYLLYLTGDPTVAEDLTGETFERALRRWRRFDPRRGAPKTWLCQLARSTALDHFRSERRRQRREDAAGGFGPEVGEARFGEGLSAELEDGLRRLSAGEREVIALRVLLDLDDAAAAKLLGISKSACSTRLSRALGKLESFVKGEVHV